MRIIHTNAERPADTLGQLALYNGFDCLALPEIQSQLVAELDANQRGVYDFEMRLQAALLEMEFNGIHVDINERTRLINQHRALKAKLDSYIDRLCTAIGYYDYYKQIANIRYHIATGLPYELLPNSWADWLAIPIQDRKVWKQIDPGALKIYQNSLKDNDKPFNTNSNDQKLILLYHFFGTPNNISNFAFDTKLGKLFEIAEPPWKKTKGIPVYKNRKADGRYGPSADRAALEKIEALTLDSDPDHAAYWVRPFLSLVLSLADVNKTLQFLNCKLENGIFRSSFAASTETGRLSSKKNAQDYGWNAQNVAPKNRIIFTAPLGEKIGACDYEQIESRMVAAICYILFGATAYFDATESGDLHSLACSMVWDDLPWPKDFTLTWLAAHGPFPKDMVKAAKKVAGQIFYRGKSRRDLSKTLGHGSNYMGKPPNMAKQSHIDLNLVQHYQDIYFAAFPEIKLWHNWVIEQVMVNQQLTTPIFNRTRQFFGRPSDDATIREAVAYCPQSMAADYTNRALVALHEKQLAGGLPIRIVLQKHDEIGFYYAEPDEQVVIPQVRDIMEQSHLLVGPEGQTRKWTIPAEALVGWNLSHRIDYKSGKKLATPTNPDGLVEFPDTRIRETNPFAISEIRL